MTEKSAKTTKNKHGAGKFLLGAALGAAAGALASKFIKIDFTSDDEPAKKPKACKCDDDCKCDKGAKCDKSAEKKLAEKKTADKKSAGEKK